MGYPGAEADHGYAVNNYGSLKPSREDFSKAGWDPVFNFVGTLVGGLFDLFDGEDEKKDLAEVYGTDEPETRFAQMEGGWVDDTRRQ
jgi:hypothetical protein